MTEKQPLNLVVAYDRNRNEYSVAAHNLTQQEAEAHVTQQTPHLRSDCSFIVLPQKKQHRSEPKDCRACRETVSRSAHLSPSPTFVRRQEP